MNNLYQDFFNFMANEHNLVLTIQEMDEILHESSKLQDKLNKSYDESKINNKFKE